MPARIGHHRIAAAFARDDLHDTLGDDRAARIRQDLGERLNQPLRIDRKSRCLE
jgi:hypothetical protein